MTAARRAEIAYGLRNGIVSSILYGYMFSLYDLVTQITL